MLVKNKRLLAGLITVLITITACKNSKRPDIPEKELISIDFQRFENDVFAPSGSPLKRLQQLRSKHGSFTDVYLKQVIGLHVDNDTALASELDSYITDKYIKEVYEQCDSLYHDLTATREKLNDAFNLYKFYFPGKIIPSVKTFIAPFNYNTIATDSVLGIGLDMYLGADYKYYPSAGFPLYKIKRLSKEYMASDAVSAWLQSDYQPEEDKNDLLNNMIHEGKILYATQQLLPEVNDTIVFGFSPTQLKWCAESEASIWSFFIEEKLLFNKNTSQYIKFINDGAGTNGFPKEAPARLGVYIGWKIVKTYMEKHTETNLKQLMEMKDGGKVLIESGYKPGK